MDTSAPAIAGFRSAAATQRRAILCVLGAGFSFAVGAALIKATKATHIPVAEMVVFRSVVIATVMAFVLRRQGGIVEALRTRRPLGHVVRTGLGFVAMYTSFIGYLRLPLATVTALGFAMPLFLTLLSVPLLGEKVGLRRGAAVLGGLLGVLVVVQPWRDLPDEMPMDAVALVLAGVVAWAFTMITIRKLGTAGERNATIVLWYCLGALVISLVLAVPDWVVTGTRDTALLIAAGVASAAGQLLMTEGYRTGTPSVVSPFEYGAIVHATLFGMLLWGEWPDAWSFCGIAVLIGAGLYIWRMEAAPDAAAPRR